MFGSNLKITKLASGTDRIPSVQPSTQLKDGKAGRTCLRRLRRVFATPIFLLGAQGSRLADQTVGWPLEC